MDEKSEMVADLHSILGRWRKYFSQLLNIHGVNDVSPIILAFLVRNGHLNPQVTKVLCGERCGHLNAL